MSPNPEETADLVTFTEEIFNEEFYFFVKCRLLVSKGYYQSIIQNIYFSEHT